MHIAIIATSPRKNSNSLRFANFLKQTLAHKIDHSLAVVDFHDYDLPNVGRGVLDPHNLSAFQKNLIENWAKADLVFFALPEYNFTVNGDFLNALHVLGSKDYKHLFENKVFALAGISSGRGGKVPCLDTTNVLNKIINFSNTYSVVSPRIFEAHEIHKNLDENSQSTGNEIFDKTVEAFIDYSLEVRKMWRSNV
ncbi:MAG: NAD(P)H-dependent oxidoreductase [Pseudarcicella sp.]|nr:NAD(P)H-dependent oxidoreductase [Pseudarcicella sp.]